MSAIHSILLWLIHLLYSMVLEFNSLKKRHFASPPQELSASRGRIPKHLAIVFALDRNIPLDSARDALTESVLNAVEWCRTTGIKKLTVYEENDMLSQCTPALCERLPIQEHETDSSESDIDYPLTPPPSDHSESRPLSPSDLPQRYTPITKLRIAESISQKHARTEQQKLYKRRQSQKPPNNEQKSDLLLCMISAEASKPAIAAVAQALAERERRRLENCPIPGTKQQFKLTVEDLDQILEDEDGLSSPDFMIIHPLSSPYSSSTPPELHGISPWHIRLTEIFQNCPRDSHARSLFNWRRTSQLIALDELGFREALDEFASAEMRFGK